MNVGANASAWRLCQLHYALRKVLEQHDMLTARRVLAGLQFLPVRSLLFMVEPLFAKRILPWFGGSAAVWSTCLVFYQTALLAGYLYARVLSRFANCLGQAAVHIGVLLLALLILPIGPSATDGSLAVGAQPIGTSS